MGGGKMFFSDFQMKSLTIAKIKTNKNIIHLCFGFFKPSAKSIIGLDGVSVLQLFVLGLVWSGLVQVEDLQSVFLLELKILLVEGVYSINHGLDKLNLRVTQTVFVGNIISST